MAQAIEKSICVLVWVTEKYKESNFCRLEAEYITQKNKPFIPILMEKGYGADGWLCIILGSKICAILLSWNFQTQWMDSIEI